MYNEIKKLLHNHNMNEALEKLTEFASSTDNWQIKSEIENLKTTYGFMIQYAAQGVNDPDRKKNYITSCSEMHLPSTTGLNCSINLKPTILTCQENTLPTEIIRCIHTPKSA